MAKKVSAAVRAAASAKTKAQWAARKAEGATSLGARIPGGPTPASAAATQAQYFDPQEAPVSGLAEAADIEHVRAVRAQAQTLTSGLSADEQIAVAAPSGSEAAALAKDIARIRALDRPRGGPQQKLAYAKRAGYHRHWFNDSPGRVDEAESRGWAFVKDKNGKSVRRNVDRGREGKGLDAFLMEIPEVIWLEDMADVHRAASERMDGIRKNPFIARPGEAKAGDSGKFYSPAEVPLAMRESMVKGGEQLIRGTSPG